MNFFFWSRQNVLIDVCILSIFVTDMLQINTAELAAKAEDTRGQLRHLDQQVGYSALHNKIQSNPISTDFRTRQQMIHGFAGVGLNITDLVKG